MTQDEYTDEPGVGWGGVLLGLAVTVIILAVLGLGLKVVMENTALQKDFNRTMVACVQAGKDPLACRAALSGNVVQ